MSTSFSLLRVMRHSLVAALAAGAAVAVAGAQSTPTEDNTRAAQPLQFQTPALPVLSSTSADALFSSSADANTEETGTTAVASLEKNFNFPGANAQYGRRRYGATRYRGSNTNADGSEKYTGFVGAGFAAPSSNQFNYATTSWGFQAGAGRNFNRHVGVDLEFDYDHFGMTGATLQDQQNLYNFLIDTYSPGAVASGNGIAGLGGNNHIWSLSLDPVYNIKSGEGIGAYVTGGVGYYHKVANFTVPAQESYCDYYGYCYNVVANQVIDHYTSNAFGVNAGVGFTYKFSRFANERLYGEVRYVYTLNSARPGVTAATVSASNVDVTNDFPQNSNRTGYLPVKFGIRF